MILNIIDLCSNIFSNLKFAGDGFVFLASKEVSEGETDIPSSGESLLQLLGLLVLFIIILIACYYVTKWVANVSSNSISASNIKVIETYKITTNKYIQIIKIAGEYIAVAISKEDVTFLCKLEEDNINMLPEKTMEMRNFKDILSKAIGKKDENKDDIEEDTSGKEETVQDTSQIE